MTLTNEQLETLKGMDWQDDRGDTIIYFGSKNHDAFFEELTQRHIKSLRELLGDDDTMETAYWEIAYRKHSETYFDLHYAIWCKNTLIKDDVIQSFDYDVLGLFTKKDDVEPVGTVEEKFFELFDAYLKEHDAEEIRAMLEEKYTDVWNDIATNVIENADADDLTDDLKDEVGREWAENNTNELKDLFLDNASSYELKEMATDIINDYL